MPLRPVESEAELVVARDGTRRRVRRWPARRPFMGMLILPTWGSHGGRYERFAGEVALSGVHIEALDLAGHGESDGPRGGPPSWTMLLDDVEDRLAALRRQLGDRPICLFGHGLGGLVALDFLESDRPGADLSILMAPSMTLRPDILPFGFRLPWQHRPDAVPVIDDVGRLARDPDLGASWRSDPLVVRQYTVSFLRIVVDVQRRVVAGFDRVTLPLWLGRSGLDPIAPERRPVIPGFPSTPDRRDTFASGHDAPNDTFWHRTSRDLTSWFEIVATRHWPSTLEAVRARDPEQFSRLPRAEAKAAFDAYVAAQPARIARLEAIVQRRGGPSLDCEPDALDRLGAWVLETLEWAAPGERPPAWAHTPAGHELSAESAALAEGAAALQAACVLAANPEAEWRLCTTKIDHYYHRPLVEPFHLSPESVRAGIVLGARDDPPRAVPLGRQLRGSSERPVDDAGPGMSVDDALPIDEIGVDAVDPAIYGGRFNATIWIPEGAETVLGKERFDELPGRLARLKGVSDLVHEDREVFLVRVADGQDLDELRRRVVAVVRRSRDAAQRDAEGEDA